MTEFEQIWESSRHNSWSWAYPTVLCAGILTLLLLSRMRKTEWRRAAKILAIIVFTMLATEAAGREIAEKWLIRQDWATQHAHQMTSSESSAVTADGANLVMGPLVSGFDALLLFAAVSAVLWAIRAFRTKQLQVEEQQKRAVSLLQPEEKVVALLEPSDANSDIQKVEKPFSSESTGS